MRIAAILRLLSLGVICALTACATPSPDGARGGRGGRGGIAAAGRGDTVPVGQRGRGAGRGGVGRGRGAQQSPASQLRTYRFEETGQMLEYAVYASTKVNKDTKSPLVIALHGRGTGPNSIMRRLTGPAEQGGFIVAAPMGYHERGWFGVHDTDGTTPPELREYSEKDVMNVLALVREEFNIDEKRIYLMGYSMGGAGALHLAIKHPQLWAAVGAVAPALRPSQRIESTEAIRHLPVMLIHGDRDRSVTVDVSRRLSSHMKKLGMTYEYREIPGGSHGSAISTGAPWMMSFFERHAKSDAQVGAVRLGTLAPR